MHQKKKEISVIVNRFTKPFNALFHQSIASSKHRIKSVQHFKHIKNRLIFITK